MTFIGKYTFDLPTPAGTAANTFLLRNYYTGALHGTLLDAHGNVQLASNIETEGDTLRFQAQAGPCLIKFTMTLTGPETFTGTAEISQQEGQPVITPIQGTKGEITPADDGADKIEMKKKALILYATITKNTATVAEWFKETFEHYGMDVHMVRVLNGDRWLKENEGKLYFEDYDVVCMGSPIIGGSPMKCMLSHFSAGAASSLEDRVSKNAEAGLGFNAGGAGNFKEGEVKGGPGMPPPPPGGPGGPPPEMMKSYWSREEVMPYPGGPHYQGRYQPLGIVFTTYGGGFCGPDECLPTLALLKLYMEDKGAKVVGRFACPGKEFGPAGLDDGEVPMQIHEPPVYYKDADGNYHAGGFFFHCHANSRPGPREEAQAKAFIADIV
ncbi:MAG: hypothetical protein LUH36_00985, partial [Oscillospiraceae bacterium]|nr:hypothetical protein [Oscillospiraceae bacterium]